MFSGKLLVIETKEIESKKGEKFKLFTLVNTEKYTKLQLLGSQDLPLFPSHTEVEITVEISPRQKGYSIFVQSIKPV